MKIAYFINGINQIGGAEIATRRLAEQVSKRGHKVTLIGTEAITDWRKHPWVTDYAKLYRLIRLPIWQRSRTIFARTLIAQALWSFPLLLRDTDILHIRGLTPESLSLAQIARRLGIKTLCVPMASGSYGDVAQFPVGKRREIEVLNNVSALTEPLRNELLLWGFPAERVSVIPNGVDVQTFKPASHIPGASNVIFVGQFRPEKRVDLLLSAWTIVQNTCSQAQLTLLGGGDYLDEYEQLAKQLGVHAHFVPNTDAAGVLTHLHKNSIFVLPGISEGMSNALLEAMAVGLAPIVSATPANCAVIRDGINGLCYATDSAEALAAEILQLISDDILHAKLGENARQTVETHFTLDCIVDQYLALYAQMLGENR
jgi:glycosyltransferase involved in cell wall biosynthesis